MNERLIKAIERAICDHAEAGKYNRLLAASLNDIQAMGKLRKIRYQSQAVYDAIEAMGYSVVPIEPNERQREHVKNLVSIFVADDDHLRFVTEDLIIRSYRAMCREALE